MDTKLTKTAKESSSIRFVVFGVIVDFALIVVNSVALSLKQLLPRDELPGRAIRVLTGTGYAGGTIRLP